MSYRIVLERILGKLEADAVHAIAFESTGGKPSDNDLVFIAVKRISEQVKLLDDRISLLLEEEKKNEPRPKHANKHI